VPQPAESRLFYFDVTNLVNTTTSMPGPQWEQLPRTGRKIQTGKIPTGGATSYTDRFLAAVWQQECFSFQSLSLLFDIHSFIVTGSRLSRK
jgi:hypothetical protein